MNFLGLGSPKYRRRRERMDPLVSWFLFALPVWSAIAALIFWMAS